ncbi:MAG TPA: NADH-quinone oxidoreductase subunit NuoF [Anaerolineae bacterium]|nr:NADH-quinone oxidoreductase subunit NuoF [Anaerolineae bacterium]
MPELDLTLLRDMIAAFSSQGRAGLLPALQAAQALYGWIAEPVAVEIGRTLNVPLADIHGVIEFYSMLYHEPVGRTIVRVCTDPACSLFGAERVLEAACRSTKVTRPGETSADGEFTIERSPCLGLCNAGVGVGVTQPHDGRFHTITYGNVRPATVNDLFTGHGRPAEDYVGGDIRIVTALCGRGHTASLNEYEAAGGMRALRQILEQPPTPQYLIDQLKQAGLLGRGGAAFPTWIKWEGALKAANKPKYFVINADESEPGTFKDRILLEGDPCRIIEGALIGAYTIGAQRAYIYIRGEYPRAIECVQHAIAECQSAGYLGQNILGSGYDLELEVRSGAGAYICGEETALFESIEGKRGFPRMKPPFPATYGLFGQPTVINNVETLVKIPYIFTHGAEAFARFGTEKSAGPKLFCVSGDVTRPGLYEVPFGVTLRHLVEDLAGGVADGKLQAILLGGAAGGFATAQDLDVKMTFEDLRARGLPLGSGAVMVFNDKRDLRDILLRLGRFFAHESCGKCYPCQLGTQRQYEILQRLAAGQAQPDAATQLNDIGWTMSDASICGLGQSAAWAVQSAMKLWPEMFNLT